MIDQRKTFTLFWRTGETQIVRGLDPAGGMNSAGIGRGALAALDFWAHGDARDEYVWNPKTREWGKR